MAAGPQGAKSPTEERETLDNDETHWRVNSSYSPPPPRIWNCRLQADGVPNGGNGVPLHGLSVSSNSRGNRSRVGSERYSSHHHSVSDGVLSYSESPPENVQVPRWTSPVPKFNMGEFAASTVGGSRSQSSWFPRTTERRYAFRAAAVSPSFGSPSSLSESSQLESTSKHPFSLPNRNFPSRRSYMSKAVYPLVFRNPVSDCDTFGDADIGSIGRLTPSEDHQGQFSPSDWLDNSSSVEHKFHKTLTELQRLEASPNPSTSSRREGFRWSSASSYDLGFDGEKFDIVDHIDGESLRSPIGPVTDQKCGVCGKLLWQKSPWSSHRIMRGGDMPTAGILPCSHVFHAECLEQVTPKIQIHDPPCPLCLKTIGAMEESSSVSEPLQMALRSIRRGRGVAISEPLGNHPSCNSENPHHIDTVKRSWAGVVPRWSNGGSSIRNRLKRHFTFNGKVSKDIFNAKVLQRIGSSSSSREPVRGRMSIQ